MVEPLAFVLLDPPRQELERRLSDCSHHFMPAALLASQLEALEKPGPDELCFTADSRLSPASTVDAVVTWLVGAAG